MNPWEMDEESLKKTEVSNTPSSNPWEMSGEELSGTGTIKKGSVDLGNVFTYSIEEKGGPLNGRELGKVSASSTRDAMSQAEGMGYEKGRYTVKRVSGPVEPVAKPKNLNEREALLIRRGVPKEDARTAARLMPYAVSDLADKPVEDLSYGAMQKDVFSLPGRTLTSLLPWGRSIVGTDAQGEVKRESISDAIGRTSEDEGTNLGGAIGRSPVTGATIAAAPFIPEIVGAATPGVITATRFGTPIVTGLTEGAVASGAGTTLSDNYSSKNATIDFGVSLLLPIVGQGLKIASRARAENLIKSTLKDNGVDASDDVIEGIYSRIFESGSVIPSAKAAGKKIQDENMAYLTKEMEPGAFLNAASDKDAIVEGIRGSLGKASNSMKPRSLNEASKDIGRINEFFTKQKMLEESTGPAGKITNEEYQKHMLDLIQEYSDIPELMDKVRATLSKGKSMEGYVLSRGEDFVPLTVDKDGIISMDWSGTMGGMRAGEALNLSGLGKTVPFVYEHPVVSGASKAKSLATSPYVTEPVSSVLNQASYMVAPEVLRKLKKDKEEEGQNLSTLLSK